MDTWIRGKPVADFDRLVGCVVIHDQMQFLVGVGLANVFEEPQKLLATVPRLGDSGDLAGDLLTLRVVSSGHCNGE